MKKRSPWFSRKAGLSLRFLRLGLRITHPDRWRLSLLVLLSMVVGGLEVVLLALLAAIILAMTDMHLSVLESFLGGGSGAFLPIAAAGLIAFLVALAFPLARMGARISTDAIIRLRGRLLRAYHASSLTYRDTHREHYLAQLAGENCNRSEILVQHLVTALGNGAILLMFLIAAVRIAPVSTLLMLAGFSLLAWLLAPLLRKMRRDRVATTVLSREMIAQVGQMSRLSEAIAAFHVGARAAAVLDVAAQASARVVNGLRYENRLMPSLYQYGALALVLAVIQIWHATQRQDIAGLAPVAFLLLRALGYVRGLSAALQNGAEQAPFAETLLDELAALEDHPAPDGRAVPERFAGLRFERVGYAYRDGHPVLEDVSFEIQPGEMVGLVGPSGGGKSTLASLMLRLRIASHGRILTGGVSLEDVSAQAWASLSGLVSQDARLIHGTVADNIRFFRPDISLSQVKAAAAAAHLDAEIEALGEGYETLLGPGARDLSGGQRQRLAIARALLGKPQFLVLDEPSSALDKTSERLLVKTLEELKGRTTIVVIAHRPDTIAVCERVLHVEQGRVREVAPAAP